MLAGVAAVVVLGACGDDDDAAEPTVPAATSSSTAPAVTTPPTSTPATGVAPVGFERVAARVIAPDGETCDVCLWLADTGERRAQGLMGVTDLSGADGMVFRWSEPTTGSFWMRDTPLPLSIAFFAADGSFVSAADMEPCLDPVPDAECPRYAAAGPYTDAIEVAAGGLPGLLIGPGSRLEVSSEPCSGPMASS